MITAINKAAIEIAAKVLNTATRNDLNKYSHIVDISYNALKINQSTLLLFLSAFFSLYCCLIDSKKILYFSGSSFLFS